MKPVFPINVFLLELNSRMMLTVMFMRCGFDLAESSSFQMLSKSW